MNGKKLSTYAKEKGISYLTAWRLVKNNKIKYEKLPTGTIVVLEDEKPQLNDNIVVLYARVSSSENKKNLDSQMNRLRDYASAKGYTIVNEYKEIGSGLNDKRKKLNTILSNDNWSILLVEHKDRLARFGINYLELLLNKQGKKIEVINNVDSNTQEDLMQDFVSLVTSFTARLYGLRRSKRRTEKLIKTLKNEK
jgi:putative resolvase